MPINLAGDVGVSGPPTISAATVNAIFARLGSPMAGTGNLVEQASRKANIDDAFALAVWWTETNDGAAGVGLADRNPGSVRGSVGYPSAFDGYTIYPSYSAAIAYWFNMLRNFYVNRGMSTVYAIAHTYVGTASYPLWAGKVIALMYKYRGLAPPPPASLPKPTVNPSIVAANKARTHKLAAWLQYLRAHDLTTQEIYELQAQKINSATATMPQPAKSASTLPFGANLAIVFFGLLAALAIALYARKLPVAPSQEDWSSVQKTPADLPLHNQHVPFAQKMLPTPPRTPAINPPAPSTSGSSTINVRVAPGKISPTPAFSLPSRNHSTYTTDAIPRRITLLPTNPNENPSSESLLRKYHQQDDARN